MGGVNRKRNHSTQRLLELLAVEGPLDVVEGALLVAAEEYHDLDVAREAGRVRTLAAESARRAAAERNPFARLEQLRALLFDELGFRGNLQEFNDPRNSFLNDVLDRRLGNPLTLSSVFLGGATATGFDARGVGLPGHFVTRLSLDGRTFFVDPFHNGRVITEDDCRQLVVRTTGRASLFHRELLQGTDPRSMLARLLLNLKHVYIERSDYERALSAVERLLLVQPGDASETRDRGFLKAHLGQPSAAIADLERYLAGSPSAPDAIAVRGRVNWLRRRLSELN